MLRTLGGEDLLQRTRPRETGPQEWNQPQREPEHESQAHRQHDRGDHRQSQCRADDNARDFTEAATGQAVYRGARCQLSAPDHGLVGVIVSLGMILILTVSHRS